MKKVIRLTESDLMRIVRRVIEENNASETDYDEKKPVGRDEIRSAPSKMGRAQMPTRRRYDDLNENDFEDEEPIDREAAYQQRQLQKRKASLENMIQNRDLETILTLLGDDEYHVERFLKELKPLGITTYDELVAYKEGNEDEY